VQLTSVSYAHPPRKDWCTSRELLEPVYAVFDVDLDPCSNPSSVVEAKHHIWLPRYEEKVAERPDMNVELGNGIASPWTKFGRTVYVNPPFGDDDMPQWIGKMIHEREQGAEIIALLPAYPSSQWFANMWATADGLCWYGIPGRTPSRAKFIGAASTAPFAIMFVYWGPDVDRFAESFQQVGQIDFLAMNRLLTSNARNRRLARVKQQDIWIEAERKLRSARYSDLVLATQGLEDQRLGDIFTHTNELATRLGALRLGDVLDALVQSVQEVAPASTNSVGRPTRARGQKVVAAATTDAAGAAAPANDAEPGPRTPPRRRTAAVDTDALIAAVRAAPLCTMSDLEDRTGADRAQLRAPLTRLIEGGFVTKLGQGRGTQYKLSPNANATSPEASSAPNVTNEEEE